MKPTIIFGDWKALGFLPIALIYRIIEWCQIISQSRYWKGDWGLMSRSSDEKRSTCTCAAWPLLALTSSWRCEYELHQPEARGAINIGNDTSPLRTTMAHTDYFGAFGSDKVLFNILDFYSTPTAVDTNHVEHIEVLIPSGACTLELTATSMTKQPKSVGLMSRPR